MANKLEKIVEKEGTKESVPSISDYVKRYASRAVENVKGYIGDCGESLADKLTRGSYFALIEENKNLKKEVEKDSLTGLYNKRKLKKDLEEQINLYNRHIEEFSLVMMDIDNF